jgi:hypothetical protein
MVLIIGYGTEKTKRGYVDYWIAQNTLSVQYGERGYFKIARGKNMCKIANDVWTPIVISPKPKPIEAIKTTPRICKRNGDILRSSIIEKSFCIVESVSIDILLN